MLRDGGRDVECLRGHKSQPPLCCVFLHPILKPSSDFSCLLFLHFWCLRMQIRSCLTPGWIFFAMYVSISGASDSNIPSLGNGKLFRQVNFQAWWPAGSLQSWRSGTCYANSAEKKRRVVNLCKMQIAMQIPGIKHEATIFLRESKCLCW